MKKLDRSFYDRDSIVVAEALLDKLLIHEFNGHKISARIVETEAYMGVTDKAAHSYGGRRTPRVEVMYGDPGYSYVFFIYGMHCCFNIVTREKGNPQAVLLRAVQPVEGFELMAVSRYNRSFEELTPKQQKNLTNGPGKLCKALSLTRDCNAVDLCGDAIYIAEDGSSQISVVSAKRVGIDYAEEAVNFPWRFYIKGNEYVSVK